MTQNYLDIKSTDIVGESLDPLKNRDQANKTNFMGTAFPEVTSEDVGMTCVIIKTENDINYKQVWRLVGVVDNQPQWMLERDLNRGIVYSDTSSDHSIDNYQDKNTLLTSLSSLTAEGTQENANKFPYLSETNTFALSGISTLARTLLANSTASDMRSTLGLGSLATKSTVTGSDIGQNEVALSNMAKGTYGKCISYTSGGNPTLVSLPAGVPVGSIMMYPAAVLPDNSWIFLYGQQLDKTTYSELWAFASGSNNITSDLTDWYTNRPGSFYNESSTVFRVPDLRNVFIRPWDGPTGATRTVGNIQAQSMMWHQHFMFSAGRGLSGNENLTSANSPSQGSNGYQGHDDYYINSNNGTPNKGLTGISGTSNETRPINIAIPFIMKARALAL